MSAATMSAATNTYTTKYGRKPVPRSFYDPASGQSVGMTTSSSSPKTSTAAEQERAEQERAEQERAEQERAEQERAEQERAEHATQYAQTNVAMNATLLRQLINGRPFPFYWSE
jgi:uncharacterized protein YaiL (DUF2058 family)